MRSCPNWSKKRSAGISIPRRSNNRFETGGRIISAFRPGRASIFGGLGRRRLPDLFEIFLRDWLVVQRYFSALPFAAGLGVLRRLLGQRSFKLLFALAALHHYFP